MWIFGFGSLMWDGWHEQHGCISSTKAQLVGYRRRFNKASVVNWGTKHLPGPTLNIEKAADAMCHGLAFEFPAENKIDILEYLHVREGKAFGLVECDAILSDGRKVIVIVPIYRGKNVLDVSLEILAEMAITAKGTSGKCADYVLNIERELISSGIEDPEVFQLATLVKQRVNIHH